MKKGQLCAAVNCNYKRGNGKSMFRFPRNQERCHCWIINCGRKDLLEKWGSIPVDKYYATYSLCSEHFEESQFMNATLKNALIHCAVPTIFHVRNPQQKIGVTPPKDFLEMEKPCCAINCTNRQTNGVSCFRFPENKERCHQWILNTRRADLIDIWNEQELREKFYQNYFLCSKHFESKYFINPAKSSLVHHAVPTLFDDVNFKKLMNKSSLPNPPEFVQHLKLIGHLNSTSTSDLNSLTPGCSTDDNVSHQEISNDAPSPTVTTNVSKESVIQFDSSPDYRQSSKCSPEAEISSSPSARHVATCCSSPSVCSDTRCVSPAADESHQPTFTPELLDLLDVSLAENCLELLVRKETSRALATVKKEKIDKKNKLIDRQYSIIRYLEAKLKKHDEMTLEELITNQLDCKPLTKSLLISEIGNRKNKCLSSRYSNECKQMALQMYFYNPREYNFMRNFLSLPHPSSIQNWLCDATIKDGFIEIITDLLKNSAASLSGRDLVVSLIFEKVRIQERLIFDKCDDKMFGYEDVIGVRSQKFANEAHVFMIRSLSNQWKLPFAFVLTHDTCHVALLAELITRVISKINETGFIIKLVVCNQAPTNRKCMATIGVTRDNPRINLKNCAGDDIFFMYNTPQLLKSVRNTLRKRDMLFRGKIASWQHITALYEAESERLVKAAPKLSKRHVYSPAFPKLPASLAIQVFSHSVSSALLLHVSFGSNKVPVEATNTAEFLESFDKLFNIFNSATKNCAEYLKRPLSKSSPHWQELDTAQEFIDSISLVGAKRVLPSITGWLLNINSLRHLWHDLHNIYHFKSLSTQKLNQDIADHFFNVLRCRRVGRFPNPDPVKFSTSYKNALISYLMKTSGLSSLEDHRSSLLLQYERFAVIRKQENSTSSIGSSSPFHTSVIPYKQVMAEPDLDVTTLFEDDVIGCIAGFICSTVADCCETVVNFAPSLDAHEKMLNKLRSFSNISNLGPVCIPSDDATDMLISVEKVLKSKIPEVLSENKLVSKCKELCLQLIHNKFCCSSCFDTILTKYISLRLQHEAKCISDKLKEERIMQGFS